MDGFFGTLADAAPQLLDGIRVTLTLTIGGALLAIAIAFLLGFGSRAGSRVVRGGSRVIVEFFRGTSLVVQLFWFVYAMPVVTGFQLDDPMYAGIIALGLNYGAYGAEVVRGAIAAVPDAQWEAGVALNFTGAQRMRLVILPQAVVGMIPPFSTLFIQLLKGSSLAILVGIADLSFEAEKIRLNNASAAATAFTISLVLYFVLAWLINLGMKSWETHAKTSIGQPPPPSRWRLRTTGGGEIA